MRVKYIGPDRSLPGFGKVGHTSIIEATQKQVDEFCAELFEPVADNTPVNILPYGTVPFDAQAFQRKQEKQHRVDVDEAVEEKRLATEQH